MNVGIRVVRGPSWNWGGQDGGCVGTVIRPFDSSFNIAQSGTVFVQWDNGTIYNYRVGKDGDLRILDSGPAGVRYGHSCDECCQKGIIGTRWQCTVCDNYDLCNTCYHDNKHDLTHPFMRYDSACSNKITEVSPRANSQRSDVYGIFPGAEVVRCVDDWLRSQNDGGMGGIRGTVLEASPSMLANYRQGVVTVLWQNGYTLEHSRGSGGSVSVKCVATGVGPKCYIDHLAVLEEDVIIKRVDDKDDSGEYQLISPFSLGDKVQVNMDVSVFHDLQDPEHGGWNDEMDQIIGKTGVVVDLSGRIIVVWYKSLGKQWAINPKAITKKAFDVGDKVRVSSNEEIVRNLQKGYGGWVQKMKEDLGKLGKVSGEADNGRILVKMKGRRYSWALNPGCIAHADPSLEPESEDIDEGSDCEYDSETDKQMALDPRYIRPELLVEFAAKNRVQVVKAIVENFPQEVNIKISGRTALHMSCLKGHAEIVRLLLQAGADPSAADDEGNTPMHYAVIGKDNPRCLRMFSEHGFQNMDLVNFKLVSVLHQAARVGNPNCIRTLLELRCNVNAQDEDGDTALHDAIHAGKREAVACLTQARFFNYSIVNERGENVLHAATHKGDAFAVEKIVLAAPHMVEQQSRDGFTPMLMAASGGHRDVVEVLLTKGGANKDSRGGRGQTPVMMFMCQSKISTIELMINKGADPNAQERCGHTALHFVMNIINAILTGQLDETIVEDLCNAPEITSLVDQLPPAIRCASWVGAALFLIQHGASIYSQNYCGKTPLQMITDQTIIDLLQDASEKCSTSFNTSMMPRFRAS